MLYITKIEINVTYVLITVLQITVALNSTFGQQLKHYKCIINDVTPILKSENWSQRPDTAKNCKSKHSSGYVV